MTLWVTVLVAGLRSGVPGQAGRARRAAVVAGPSAAARISALLPVSLLAALVAVQTVTPTGGWCSTPGPPASRRPRWPCSCARRSWSW